VSHTRSSRRLDCAGGGTPRRVVSPAVPWCSVDPSDRPVCGRSSTELKGHGSPGEGRAGRHATGSGCGWPLPSTIAGACYRGVFPRIRLPRCLVRAAPAWFNVLYMTGHS
jgi:hypothetical protein